MEVSDIIYESSQLKVKVIYDLLKPLGAVTVQRINKNSNTVVEEITLTSEEIKALYRWIEEHRGW